MIFKTLTRTLSMQPCSCRRIKITLLGGDTALGSSIAFQLKVLAVVPEIRLHGSTPLVRELAEDLNQIPTVTRILPFSGPNQLKQALTKADVVLVYSEAGCEKLNITDDTLFNVNAPIVEKIAKTCVSVCPEAVYALLTPPLNSTVPLFAQVLKENGVFKTSKLVGIVSDMTMTARKLVAASLGLSPKTIWLPITGGASPTTLVPVITGARPGGIFLGKEAKILSDKIRSVRQDIKNANCGVPGSIGAGYAIADFIKAISEGLLGEETEAHPALVRARVVDGLDYIVVPVHFGPNGISEAHGIPDMTPRDMALMDSAVNEMMGEQARVHLYLAKRRTACVACDSPPMPTFGQACGIHTDAND